MNQSYYADSSALIKRHVAEVGSLWVQQEFDAKSGNQIITLKLSIVEVLSGLNRRKRELNLLATQYALFSGDFLKVAKNEYELFDLTDIVIAESRRLLENYPLRAGDAIQLASALLANAQLQSAKLLALIFLASDTRLLNAAQSEGLQTDDPQNH